MDDVESVLVLEDDVTWAADCWTRLENFMQVDCPPTGNRCAWADNTFAELHAPRRPAW